MPPECACSISSARSRARLVEGAGRSRFTCWSVVILPHYFQVRHWPSHGHTRHACPWMLVPPSKQISAGVSEMAVREAQLLDRP